MTNLPAPDDLHLMLLAWNSGSDTQRAVALDLADRNREAAITPTGKSDKPTPNPATERKAA